MNVRYRATGQPLLGDPTVEVDPSRTKERQENTRHREEIANRHDERIRTRESQHHDQAVKHFDARFKDLTADPQLLQRVAEKHQQLINEAAKKREVVQDWDKALTDIGNEVRRSVGFPTSAEREHQESLEDLKRSRGQK